MKVPNVLLIVITLVLVISLLSVWFYPSAQDYMTSNTMWNGGRDLSSVFSAEDIGLMDNLTDLPDKTALISIPYLEFSDDELASMRQFVDRGGTLLLMDDYGYGNSVLRYLGASVRFSNKPLLDPLFNYKNQWLPQITDFSPEVAEGDITVVVLNHATALINAVASETIAWSSSYSFLDANENESWDQDEVRGPLPIAAQFRFGKGTVVIVSDPSIMINSMLDKGDNYAFTQYLISLNSEPESIFVDYSHLAKTPLDISKIRMRNWRGLLSVPYSMVGIMALIFIVVSRFTLAKGEAIG